MLSDNPPAPTRKPSGGPVSRRDLVANSILQLDIDNELDTFTADIDCLVDSSDEEEQQQSGGKDRSEPQGRGDSESAGEAGGSSKREKKGNGEEDNDEGDVSCRLSSWCMLSLVLVTCRSSCSENQFWHAEGLAHFTPS